MKKWKIISLSAVSGLLIAGNLYLIGKEESKVERTLYVENWTKAKLGDISKTFQVQGMVVPYEEYPVYFDHEKQFQKFLVQEGDTVTAGTPLYEYVDSKASVSKANLENEKKLAENDLSAIESYISSLESYQSSIPEASSVSDHSALEADLNLDEHASSELIVSTIEQEMFKQEYEKSKIEEKVNILEAELVNLDEISGTVSAVSDVDGTVKEVNKSLTGPILTLSSNRLSIEGELSEKRLREAEEGQAITVESSELKKPLTGTVDRITAYPKSEPSMKKESIYPFKAIVKDDQLLLPVGSKVNVSIVTSSVQNVPVIPEDTLHMGSKPFVYKLTNGRVNKQYVTKGIEMSGRQEIRKGMTAGETILVEPENVPQNHPYFITALQPKEITTKQLEEISTRDKFRYLLTGLLER